MNKDLDIGKILKKIRTLKFFMNVMLDYDQIKLFKMRIKKLIISDDEENLLQ